MSIEGRGRRIPTSDKGSREVRHMPDSPQVEVDRLSGLRTFIPVKIGRCCKPHEGLVESSKTTRKTLFKQGKESRTTNGVSVTPLTRKPITPEYQTSHGGKRVGGGGTSKEAIRRAKKKQKKKRKK